MKILFTTFFAILIAACAPSTIEGLRENHANSYTFDVDENYHLVYRKILSTAQKCHQKGMITAKMMVDGDLNQDSKYGSITIALHGGLGVDTHMAIDVSALGDKKTKIIVFNALSTWNSFAQAVRAWVDEDSTECRSKNS